MRNLLFIGAALAALVAAGPASAQVYMGTDPGGVGVRAGPFAFGVGPVYGWRNPYAYGNYGYGAYGYDYGYGSSYTRPGGYANGALGYIGGSTQYRGWDDSASFGSYGYGGPYSYGSASFGSSGPYSYGDTSAGYSDPNDAYAAADCTRVRHRVVTRNGHVIYRTRLNCNR